MSFPINETKFQELCHVVNWNEIYLDKEVYFNKIKATVMTQFSKSEIEDVREFISNKDRELAKIIDGSDSAWDMRSQIIGEGLESIKEHLKHPEKILKRFEDKDFKESFLGCIPFVDDYDMVNIEYYKEAVEYINDRINEHFFKKLIHFRVYKKIQKILNEFLAGDFKEEYTYGGLQDLGSVFDQYIGNNLANYWSDGKAFYGLQLKQ